jgi:hypothetical protein
MNPSIELKCSLFMSLPSASSLSSLPPGSIHQANENLESFKNDVFVLESDLLTVKLPRKVDVTFPNAVLHWILDHGRFFKTFLDNIEGKRIGWDLRLRESQYNIISRK